MVCKRAVIVPGRGGGCRKTAHTGNRCAGSDCAFATLSSCAFI